MHAYSSCWRMVVVALAVAFTTGLLVSCTERGREAPEHYQATVTPDRGKPAADPASPGLVPTADELAPAADTEPVAAEEPPAGEAGEDPPADGAAVTGQVDGAALDGEALFRQANCGMCHDPNSERVLQAPPLSGLGANWTVPELAKFLRNPTLYAGDNSRLAELGRQYKLAMPSSKLSDDELAALAAWVLEKYQ